MNELLELFRFVLFSVPVGLVELVVDIEDLFYFEGRFVVAADQNSFPFHFFICVVIQKWVQSLFLLIFSVNKKRFYLFCVSIIKKTL